MLNVRSSLSLLALMIAPSIVFAAEPTPAGGSGGVYNVRDFGAKGDGTTTDSPAINQAIDAAAAAGGGTVRLPAGTYSSFSIHLKSNVAL